MATWTEPKNNYARENQVTPDIFNILAENERYLYEVKITIGQVQDAVVAFTASASRANIAASDTIKTAFGKIYKWFADLRALAFKDMVGTADIDNSAVTTGKIASNAVTSGKIATGAVTETKIGSGAVTESKIGASAVTTAKVANGAITTDKLAASAVTGAKVASGAITDAKVASNANIAQSKIAGLLDALDKKMDKDTGGGTGIQLRRLKAADSKYNQFALSGNAQYSITSPSNRKNLLMIQGMLTCANKFWVTMFLKPTNNWGYAMDAPVLYYLRSVNGEPNVSYGFISLEASLSGNTLYISGWKINQGNNNYSDSHDRASKCYFALDAVYELLNSNV